MGKAAPCQKPKGRMPASMTKATGKQKGAGVTPPLFAVDEM